MKTKKASGKKIDYSVKRKDIENYNKESGKGDLYKNLHAHLYKRIYS